MRAAFACIFWVLASSDGFAAETKPMTITFPITVGEETSMVASTMTTKFVSPGPPDVVFRQEARPAGAATLSAPLIVFNPAHGEPVTVEAGTILFLAHSPLGDIYCRSISQPPTKYQLRHFGICLKDSNSDGAMDEILYDVTAGVPFSPFDIARVSLPRPITTIPYRKLSSADTPRTDIVVRRALIAPASVLLGKRNSINFFTSLSVPDEFQSENSYSIHWPLLQLDPSAREKLLPITQTMKTDKPSTASVGPYSISFEPDGDDLRLSVTGAATPGLIELDGKLSIMQYGPQDIRRLLRPKQ